MRALILFMAIALVSASPNDSENALRTGIAFLEAGDAEQALASLDAAAERCDDPGLVAFNRGVALVRLGRWREAELQFVHCLDDDCIPAERRAKALYNRGFCLMQRDDLAAIRAAIECFAGCRDAASDELLIADAKHNLEVAKAKWQQLRQKQSQPPTPNDGGEENHDSKTADAATPGDPGNAGANDAAMPKPAGNAGTKADGTAKATAKQTPGAGTLPVLPDDAVLTPLSPEDTQSYLDQVAKRLQKQRQSVERLKSGPDRPNVRDW